MIFMNSVLLGAAAELRAYDSLRACARSSLAPSENMSPSAKPISPSLEPCVFSVLAFGISLFAHAADPYLPATQNRVELLETPTVEVVGATPLPGLGVPRYQMPANVGTANDKDIQRSLARNLPELLEATLPGVSVDQAQGNTHQADVSYRGFLASPRLGVPQGLSVYLDGARINEAFGDVVHWDLIPQNAIAAINLIPGSNPLFGLNTLGGALVIRTKSGEHFPGTEFSLGAGSFGQRELGFEHGGSRDEAGWFFAGSALDEKGWRDHSPSRVMNLFAKFGRQASDSDVDVSVLLGDSKLIGNQVTPESFLQQRRDSIYTYPDVTRHQAAMLTANLSRWLDPQRLLAANVYLRQFDLAESNADVNQIADNRPGGAQAFEGGINDGVANTDSASVNHIRSRQQAFGFALQHSWLADESDRIGIGASLDHSKSRYTQSYQLGFFNADRSTTATGAETELVNLTGYTTTASLHISVSKALSQSLNLGASARYNHTRVRTHEHSQPQPAPAQGLANDFTYSKLNPAIGLTWDAHPHLNAYAGMNQGNRAPSPIELSCADRNSPCVLSNAFGSDPYLKQVVARTLEAGLRGKTKTFEWQFGAYRTEMTDDILFVSSSTSAGYFSNVGTTRRQGLEALLARKADSGLAWSARYHLIDASFQSPAVLFSTNNSSADPVNGEIQVLPGHRIPGIPRQQLQLTAHWLAATWRLGGSVRVSAWSYVRGNENNQHQAGTTAGGNFIGSGRSPGYAVVDLTGGIRLGRGFELLGKIGNLFDRRYTTGGILGENAFAGGSFGVDSNQWVKETFYSPGAPRSLWAGLSFKFD